MVAQATDGKPFDVITLSNLIGGKSLGALMDLERAAWSAVNIILYAEMVRDKARVRRLRAAWGLGAKGDSIEEISEILHSALDSNEGTNDQRPRLLVDFEGEHAARESEGRMATGLLDLDTYGGVGSGELCIIAGRTNVGKSLLLYQVAMRQAKGGRPVLCFWIEDPGMEAYSRSLKAQWPTDVPLWLDERSPLGIRQLESTARLMKRKHKIEAVFVDYLQLIHAPGASKNERLEEVTSSLKALAKPLKIPIYAAAQLNRDAAGRSPGLENLRDSGAIEQDANQVWLLHADPKFQGTLEIHVAKNKSGPKGVVLVRHLQGQFKVVSSSGSAISNYWRGKKDKKSEIMKPVKGCIPSVVHPELVPATLLPAEGGSSRHAHHTNEDALDWTALADDDAPFEDDF